VKFGSEAERGNFSSFVIIDEGDSLLHHRQ
jgi:hypothetical protein